MQLMTSFLPGLNPVDDGFDAAVVIDILRATTVMTTAIHHGANQVVTTREIDEARSIASKMPSDVLLCGERGCVAIEGFHLGNSPSEYMPERVRGRDLVLTTTNGTQAIEACSRAKQVWIGCFLNLSALVENLRSKNRVALVCAGTNSTITGEDVLFAGAVVAMLSPHSNLELNDESRIARTTWEGLFNTFPTPSALAEQLKRSQGGRNLLRTGAYEGDVERCAEIDWTTVIPHRVSTLPSAFQRIQ